MAQKETARRENKNNVSPAYTVKENPRARYVHLKLSWRGELEIVVPRGYNRRGIPDVIAAKRVWLERARARVDRQTQTLPADYFEQRPARVRLRALGKTYTVHYRAASGARIRIVESSQSLLVDGPVGDPEPCALALRAWLRQQARQTLVPWLRRTSPELGLPYSKAVIRSQRSRWGSCSARRVINLNCKLLFLRRAAVDYLLVHELCHTEHLNHSAQYWALVERKLPDYRCRETALRDAWRYVPRWAGD